MSMIITAVSTPVTINQRPALVVAVGGGVVGDNGFHVDVDLRCRACGNRYSMAENPRALALSPAGATVLPGYTEMCPNCYHEHRPGTVLEVSL